MDRVIGKASVQWRVHAWPDCVAPAGQELFTDRQAALAWLRQFRMDAGTMVHLRSVVAQQGRSGVLPWRATDDQVIEEAATLLRNEVLHVHRIASPVTRGRDASIALPVPARDTFTRAAAPVGRSSAPASVTSADEADTLSSGIDAALTAAVLRAAAESGVPFCEECAKAAAGRKAA